MLRNVIKNHKIISTTCILGLGSGIYLSNEDRRMKAYEQLRGYTRSIDFVCTLATILADYKFSFRNVNEGDEEYDKVYHTVNQRCAERTLRLCRRLGGYYVKFGQMVSTLDQGVPREWSETLSLCQDKANPVPFSSVARVIREDLGVSPDEIFSEIDEKPIGAASLAQVHRAVLKTGEQVAVKIQYPFIGKYTLIDLRDCEWATRVIKRIIPTFEFTWFVPRFRENVLKEIDFESEMTNMENCRSFFKDNPSIYAPKVYHEYSSKRICMMEYIDGVKASDIHGILQLNIKPSDVAKLVVSAFSEMMFRASFLHVDPHAGNLLVRKQPHSSKPQLVLLDHGMYNYVDPGFTAFLQELWLGMVSQDIQRVEELCKPYGMENYAQLLSLAMTGRSLSANNKYGEEMSDSLRDSIEDRLTNTMRMISMDMFSKRIGIVSDMMNAMPRDFMYVFRVIEMMKGLLHHLGGKESDRLDIMTSSAIKGKFEREQSRIPFLTTIKWKIYVYLLRFRLWLNDVYIEYYIRHFMKNDYEMEYDPEVVFQELIKTNTSSYFVCSIT